MSEQKKLNPEQTRNALDFALDAFKINAVDSIGISDELKQEIFDSIGSDTPHPLFESFMGNLRTTSPVDADELTEWVGHKVREIGIFMVKQMAQEDDVEFPTDVKTMEFTIAFASNIANMVGTLLFFTGYNIHKVLGIEASFENEDITEDQAMTVLTIASNGLVSGTSKLDNPQELVDYLGTIFPPAASNNVIHEYLKILKEHGAINDINETVIWRTMMQLFYIGVQTGRATSGTTS